MTSASYNKMLQSIAVRTIVEKRGKERPKQGKSEIMLNNVIKRLSVKPRALSSAHVSAGMKIGYTFGRDVNVMEIAFLYTPSGQCRQLMR